VTLATNQKAHGKTQLWLVIASKNSPIW